MLYRLTDEELLAKWGDSSSKVNVSNIPDFEIRRGTAQILENITQYEAEMRDPLGLLTEASSVAPSSQATGQFSPIVLATARRAFPELFAWKCVGVQPMNGPVGLAYAMRIKYQGNGAEAGFDDVNYWSTFTGNLSGTSGADNAGTGVSTATAEGWALGSTTSPWPQLVYSMESTAVTANSRKIGATVSVEAQMDVKNMQGIDIARQLVSRLDYQLRAETDRELLGAMKTAAVNTAIGGATIATFQTSASDGRWQQEKYNTVANFIIALANSIGNSTRAGSGNFVVVSPRIATILQACNTNIFNGNKASVNPSNVFAEVGTLNGSITVYVDRYAISDYALAGLKGPEDQYGIVYSPYVIGLQMEGQNYTNFDKNIGLMSRYAITNSLLGAGRYYRLAQFIGLSNITQI